MLFLAFGLYEIFSSDCTALYYVLYFNFKMITWSAEPIFNFLEVTVQKK